MSVLVGLIVLATGCTTPGETPSPQEEETAAPPLVSDYNAQPHDALKPGGTLTTATGDIVPQMNRWHLDATSTTREIWDWYNPVTYIVSPDGQSKPDPDYFTSIEAETVDGVTEVTFTINEKARFNDGTPIDWRALEAVWKVCGTQGRGCESYRKYDHIRSIGPGENDKTAVVRFDDDYSRWEGMFDRLLHPDAVSEFGTAYVGQAHPEWGAGPYKVEYIDPTANKAKLVRNEDWWGDPGVLDERRFVTMMPDAAVTAVLAGKLDAAPISDRKTLANVAESSEVSVRRGTSVAITHEVMNAQVAPLDDRAVRQALMMGTDRQSLADITFAGMDHAETPPGSFVALPSAEGYRDNFGAAVPFDVTRAGQILDGAGWEQQAGGIRTKDGESLTVELVIPAGSEPISASARAQAAMMATIGVELTIKEVPVDKMADVLRARDFEIALDTQRLRGDAAVSACRMWCENSTANESGLLDPEVSDQITRDMPTQTTRDAQMRVANTAETAAFEQYGIMPLYQGPDLWVVRKKPANLGARAFAEPRIEDIGWQ